MKLVDFAPNLEKKKRDELLRTLFNPKKFKEATTITKSNEPKRPRVYCCPKCGHKDYTLAVFRHAKTADEKWNEWFDLYLKNIRAGKSRPPFNGSLRAFPTYNSFTRIKSKSSQNEPNTPIVDGPLAKSSPSKEIVSSPRQDSEMNDESQDSSMLRDATQNDPQIFDMVKSPDPPSKNMEEESVSSVDEPNTPIVDGPLAKPSTSKEIGSSPRQNRELAQLQDLQKFNSEIQFNIAQSEDVLQSTPENEHRYHYHLTTVEEDDSEMTDEAQASSMLRDATQNDTQVFDMVKSPDPPSKNMEEESVSRVDEPNTTIVDGPLAKPSTSKGIGSSPRQNRMFAQLQDLQKFNSEIQFNIAQSKDVNGSEADRPDTQEHMIIPNVDGPGAVSVCVLTDEVKKYYSRLSPMFRIRGRCGHF